MTRSSTVRTVVVAVAACLAGLTACDTEPDQPVQLRGDAPEMGDTDVDLPADDSARMNGAAAPRDGSEEPAVQHAVARMGPTRDHDVDGIIRFTHTDEGVEIDAEFTNLDPGIHAFHVHEFGDCSAPDGSSAGGHYPLIEANAEEDPGVITGNLGELEADDAHRAELSRVIPGLSLNGPRSIAGRAVVVHERGNDPTATPGGDTGARLACGVIGVARQ